MSTLPGYVWAMALIGGIGTIASICVMLWAGALGRGPGSPCRRTHGRRGRDLLERLGFG